MRTITKTLYLFNELSPEAQARAIAFQREMLIDMHREDPKVWLDEDIKQYLIRLGFEYNATGELESEK